MREIDCIHALPGDCRASDCVNCAIGAYLRPAASTCLQACAKRQPKDGSAIKLDSRGRVVYDGPIPAMVQPTLKGGKMFFRGAELWEAIHTEAAIVQPAALEPWLKSILARLPCGECKKHWPDLLAKLPPTFPLTRWSFDLHNLVNAKLGKPSFTWEEARSRYGW